MMCVETEVFSKRRVYYFGGFDPRGAGYYHKLFAAQAAKYQAEKTEVKVGPRIRAGDNTNQWTVSLRAENEQVSKTTSMQTTHVFMGWDDIIRSHWIRTARQIILAFFSTYFSYSSWLTLNRVRKKFLPAFFSGILPFVFFILYVASLGFVFFLTRNSFDSNNLTFLSVLLEYIFHIFTGIAVTYLFYLAAKQFGILWLLRIYRFNIFFATEEIREIPSRQEEWVEKIIADQIRDPVDEIIFSGHSVGTLLIVGVIDRLIADNRWQRLQENKRTHVLTLGQCYPFITLIPDAEEFRQSLRRICTNNKISWLDVTARIDPLCFFGMHPLQFSDVDVDKLSLPVLHSARFFRMYEAAQWQKIKRNKILVHFLYLMAPDKPCDFNLYELIYGPGTFDEKLIKLSHARNQN
jgi:hypothetical protein